MNNDCDRTPMEISSLNGLGDPTPTDAGAWLTEGLVSSSIP